MNAMHRTLTALSHQEPDRVPFFLLVTMHGAKELGLPLKTYFSKAEYVVEGQLRMLAKYGHDCLYGFCYGAIDNEAFGGEVLYFDDGPPNSGAPIIRRPDDIRSLEPPPVSETGCLLRVLDILRQLKARVGDTTPILGTIISPFSLPVMQMGFDKYIELIYEQPELFWQLMAVNQAFAVEWANAQLEAGATAIGYFDPLVSPSIIPQDIYRRTGLKVAQQTLAQINGAVATHMGSAPSIPAVDDLVQTGTVGIGVSSRDDLAAVKAGCRGKVAVMGNLNGIEMARWTAAEAEREVKKAIAAAGRGGGFVLSDNHGEIPWQVPDETLLTLVEANKKWGKYPLEWIDESQTLFDGLQQTETGVKDGAKRRQR
jgi:uroporphyrinogen decarboxylase